MIVSTNAVVQGQVQKETHNNIVFAMPMDKCNLLRQSPSPSIDIRVANMYESTQTAVTADIIHNLHVVYTLHLQNAIASLY